MKRYIVLALLLAFVSAVAAVETPDRPHGIDPVYIHGTIKGDSPEVVKAKRAAVVKEYRMGELEGHEKSRVHHIDNWFRGDLRHPGDRPYLAYLPRTLKIIKSKDGATRLTGVVVNKTGTELPLVVIIFRQNIEGHLYPVFASAETRYLKDGGRWEFVTTAIDPGSDAACFVAVRALDDSKHPFVAFPSGED